MIGGHLGSRASALLDGQLPAEESERAWAHVYGCHVCRDLVEREGWIKTRLAGLSTPCADAPGPLPEGLIGSLRRPAQTGPTRFADCAHRRRRMADLGLGVATLGSGAIGATVLGVLALGAAPANAPQVDRRAPVASVSLPTGSTGNTTNSSTGAEADTRSAANSGAQSGARSGAGTTGNAPAPANAGQPSRGTTRNAAAVPNTLVAARAR